MSEFNMPPGVTTSMIPGCSPKEAAIDERVEDLIYRPDNFMEFLKATEHPLLKLMGSDWKGITRDLICLVLETSEMSSILEGYDEWLIDTCTQWAEDGGYMYPDHDQYDQRKDEELERP